MKEKFKTYKKHEFNDLENMTPEEFKLLKNNIKQFGFDKNLPVVLYEGKILDGWQRYRAATELMNEGCNVNEEYPNCVAPVYEFYNDMTDDAAIELVKRNQIRRNQDMDKTIANFIKSDEKMKEIQKRVEADKAAKLQNNRNACKEKTVTPNSGESFSEDRKDKHETETDTQIAKKLGVKRNRVEKIKKLRKENPEGFEDVAAGKKTVIEINKDKKAAALATEAPKTVTVPVADEPIKEFPSREIMKVIKTARGAIYDLEINLKAASKQLDDYLETTEKDENNASNIVEERTKLQDAEAKIIIQIDELIYDLGFKLTH